MIPGKAGETHPPMWLQGGLTLVELMISITLGMLVVMATTALLVSSKTSYTAQDEGVRIQETGRYAFDVIARAVHQAAYENWDVDGGPMLAGAAYSANVRGFDASSVKAATHGIDAPLQTSVNGSDVLALRFFGVGNGTDGDGTVLNCAGFSVGAPSSHAAADSERGWSIFYVATSAHGEPELRCKYLGKTNWASDAIATGVESFQVLYGVDADNDSMPDRYVNATAIDAMDDTLILEGATAAEKAIDRNRKSHWKKVVVIKVALLLRTSVNSANDGMPLQYDLFGSDYANAQGANDPGTRIKVERLPMAGRNRLRKVFMQTIHIRNRSAGGDA
jgi:type IV pilus assembly protein PilW